MGSRHYTNRRRWCGAQRTVILRPAPAARCLPISKVPGILLKASMVIGSHSEEDDSVL